MNLKKKEIYKKYAQDTLLATFAQIYISLRSVILLPILAKTLGVEFYGIWSLIMASLSLLTPVALCELNQSMTRFLSGENDPLKITEGLTTIFFMVFFPTSLICILIFMCANYISHFFLDQSYQIIIKLSIFILFVTIYDKLILQYFRTFRQNKRYTLFIILQETFELLLIAIFVTGGYGLIGALEATFIVRFILILLGFLIIYFSNGISKPNFSLIKPYLLFSLPLVPFMLSAWIVNLSDRYIIGYLMNPTAVGIYSANYSLANVAQFIVLPLSIVLLPAITQLHQQNLLTELQNHLSYSMKFLLMLGIPACFGLSALSNSIMSSLATDEFFQSGFLILVLSFGLLLYGCSQIFGNILMLGKRTRTISIIYTSSAFLNITMNILLVPLIGIAGSAIATLFTYLIHLCFMNHISRNIMAFKIDIIFIAKSLFASFIMWSVIVRIKPVGILSIMISISIGVLVYFCLLILTKAFKKEEFQFLEFFIRSIIQKGKI